MFGLTYLDLGIIVVYGLLIIYLGWWTKRKVASSGDYFMGGRRGSKLMMIAVLFVRTSGTFLYENSAL